MEDNNELFDALDKAIKRNKSFTTQAIFTFLLYWVWVIPGLIANIVYLLEARKIRKETLKAPEGMGCLYALFVVGIVAIAFFSLVIYWYVQALYAASQYPRIG